MSGSVSVMPRNLQAIAFNLVFISVSTLKNLNLISDFFDTRISSCAAKGTIRRLASFAHKIGSSFRLEKIETGTGN